MIAAVQSGHARTVLVAAVPATNVLGRHGSPRKGGDSLYGRKWRRTGCIGLRDILRCLLPAPSFATPKHLPSFGYGSHGL